MTRTYLVRPERTVPHLLPESEHFAGMPAVLATGYLVGLVEWTCMLALDGHLDDGEQTLGVHVVVGRRRRPSRRARPTAADERHRCRVAPVR